MGNGRADHDACHRLPSGRHPGGHRPVRQGVPQPVHPLPRTQCVELRERQSHHRRAFRSCRRVALELRGTDERGQGTHPPPESESNYPGGDVRLHRIADSIARIA